MVNGNNFRPRTRSLDQTGETYTFVGLLVRGSSVVKLILNELSVDYVFVWIKWTIGQVIRHRLLRHHSMLRQSISASQISATGEIRHSANPPSVIREIFYTG